MINEDLLRERLKLFKNDPSYRLFSNNCEHLSNYLESGMAKSPQLQGGVMGLLAGCIALKPLNVRNQWAALGLVALTTCVGIKANFPQITGVKAPSPAPTHPVD